MKKNYASIVTALVTLLCCQVNAQTLPAVGDSGPGSLFGIGCDYDLYVSDVVCSGDSYTFPDETVIQNITAQVVHTSTLQTVVTACDSVITTTVDPLPTYHIYITSFDICPGDVYTFPDGTVDTIWMHTEYPSYLQTVGAGCDSTIETILNTTDIDLSVTVSGNVLTANQINAGYQWVDCDNGFTHLNGQANQSFVAPVGNFAVIIYKGSCTDTSACQQVVTVGMDDMDEKTAYIYPNPATDNVTIESSKPLYGVELYDMYGKQVFSLTGTAQQRINIPTDRLPKGVYLLNVIASSGTQAQKRLVVQ